MNRVRASGHAFGRSNRRVWQLRGQEDDNGANKQSQCTVTAERMWFTFVVVQHVGQKLGGRGDGDALLVSEFVHSASLREHSKPIAAVGGATGHCAQHVVVDDENLKHSSIAKACRTCHRVTEVVHSVTRPRSKTCQQHTFLTLPEPMYSPPVARESTHTITPPWYLKEQVVVPLWKSMLIDLPCSSACFRCCRVSAGCNASVQTNESDYETLREAGLPRNQQYGDRR